MIVSGWRHDSAHAYAQRQNVASLNQLQAHNNPYLANGIASEGTLTPVGVCNRHTAVEGTLCSSSLHCTLQTPQSTAIQKAWLQHRHAYSHQAAAGELLTGLVPHCT